jgi:hypothetical protein
MVNAELLKKHASQFKLNKNNATEFHTQLFKKHPELAEPYDADGIDPESLNHSQKFGKYIKYGVFYQFLVMYGMSEMQYFFKLPDSLENERSWRSALSNFKEHYSDVGVPLSSFNVSLNLSIFEINII